MYCRWVGSIALARKFGASWYENKTGTRWILEELPTIQSIFPSGSESISSPTFAPQLPWTLKSYFLELEIDRVLYVIPRWREIWGAIY